MRTKTKMLITILSVLLLGVAGCQQEQAGYYESLASAINTSVNAQQESTHRIIEAIDESKIADMTGVKEYTDKVD